MSWALITPKAWLTLVTDRRGRKEYFLRRSPALVVRPVNPPPAGVESSTAAMLPPPKVTDGVIVGIVESVGFRSCAIHSRP